MYRRSDFVETQRSSSQSLLNDVGTAAAGARKRKGLIVASAGGSRRSVHQ